MEKIRVLFVCLGNICRSPMAEFVFRDMVEKAGLSDQIECASAAISREEEGSPVHYGTRKKLAEVGISTAGKYAEVLRVEMRDEYDYILGMDYRNLKKLKERLGENARAKIGLLLDFTERKGEIADPWYTGDFEATYRDVFDGCHGLLAHILQNDLD